MGWHLNIVAIKQPYEKVADWLDILEITKSGANFEEATSNIAGHAAVSTFLNGFSLIFDVNCRIFHNRDFYNKIFAGEEIRMFQILQTPGFKHVENAKNLYRLTGIKEFKEELTKRNIEIKDKKDGEILAWQLFDDEIFGEQSQGIHGDLWNAKFDIWEV